jgi:hypothetical protein
MIGNTATQAKQTMHSMAYSPSVFQMSDPAATVNSVFWYGASSVGALGF